MNKKIQVNKEERIYMIKGMERLEKEEEAILSTKRQCIK